MLHVTDAFQSERTNYIFVRKKNIKRFSIAIRLLTQKKLRYAIFFNEVEKVTQFLIS